MKFLSRKKQWPFVPLAALALASSGCNAGFNGGLNPAKTPEWLVRAARATLAAQAFDRMAAASENGNAPALMRARRDWDQFGGQLAVQDKLDQANDLEADAQAAPEGQRQLLLAQSDANYWAVLRADPAVQTDDPSRLNALGYFLADRGSSATDFARAKILCTRSLALWDKAIATLPSGDGSFQTLVYERAAGPGDSLAWAQFKSGEFATARRQEEGVVRELAANAEGASLPVLPGDIALHMAAIYRACGQGKLARTFFQAALQSPPDEPTRQRAAVGLAQLDVGPMAAPAANRGFGKSQKR